jgi:hypothetical protein
MGELNLGSPREVISMVLKDLICESFLKVGKIRIKMPQDFLKQ